MPKIVKFDLGLSENDIEVICRVLEYGPDLLLASGASVFEYEAFYPIADALLEALDAYPYQRISGTALALAVECLSLASDAVAGKIQVDPDIRTALSKDIFSVNRLRDRLARHLDKL